MLLSAYNLAKEQERVVERLFHKKWSIACVRAAQLPSTRFINWTLPHQAAQYGLKRRAGKAWHHFARHAWTIQFIGSGVPSQHWNSLLRTPDKQDALFYGVESLVLEIRPLAFRVTIHTNS